MKLLGLFTSKPKEIKNPFNNKGFETSIKKEQVNRLDVSINDLSKNQVHNLKYHGGPDRVLHHYPFEHYHDLKQNFPEATNLFISGSIGENLSIQGLDESNVNIGDQYKIGEVYLEVTEPRKPCGAIDITYAQKGVFKYIHETQKCGWFYRVLKEGQIKHGDSVELIHKANTKFNLKDVYIKSVLEKTDREYLKELSELKALSKRWRERVLALL